MCYTKQPQTAACLKKQKAEKEKKEGENKNSKKDTNPKAKTESQERREASENRKRNLSQQRDNRSPQRLGNSCAQVRVQNMGNHPSGTYSDSDEEDDYDTPPETLESDNDLEEDNDDPNMPENSDDDISEDEDNEILQNRPENDSAIETGNLINFPDLLRLHNSGQDTNNSGITHSTRETFPPSKSLGARPKIPLPIGSWPRRYNPPLREVILPHLHQTPCPKGVCVPPYDEPPEPWCGSGFQD